MAKEGGGNARWLMARGGAAAPRVRVRGSEKILGSDYHVSREGLPQNWMILLGHRRLQYIGEEPLGVASD